MIPQGEFYLPRPEEERGASLWVLRNQFMTAAYKVTDGEILEGLDDIATWCMRWRLPEWAAGIIISSKGSDAPVVPGEVMLLDAAKRAREAFGSAINKYLASDPDEIPISRKILAGLILSAARSGDLNQLEAAIRDAGIFDHVGRPTEFFEFDLVRTAWNLILAYQRLAHFYDEMAGAVAVLDGRRDDSTQLSEEEIAAWLAKGVKELREIAGQRVDFNFPPWNIAIEKRDEVEARMREQFEDQLRYYLDEVEFNAIAMGWQPATKPRARKSGSPTDHFEWLARYQILEWSYKKVAEHYGMAQATLKKEIPKTAKKLGVPLRTKVKATKG